MTGGCGGRDADVRRWPPCGSVRAKSPRPESNRDLALRRRLFYPLNYGERRGVIVRDLKHLWSRLPEASTDRASFASPLKSKSVGLVRHVVACIGLRLGHA